MNNKKFAKKVVFTGTEIARDEYGDRLISAFGKTYYVKYVPGEIIKCAKMTPDQWKMAHET